MTEDTDNKVISLTGAPILPPTKEDQEGPTTEQIFEEASEAGMTKVFVIGTTDEGGIGFLSNIAEMNEAIFLLESAKHKLLSLG